MSTEAELLRNLEGVGREAGNDAYSYLSEENQAVVAFGMIPYESVKKFEDQMRASMIDQSRESVATTYGMDKKDIKEEWIKKDPIQKWLNACTRGFSLGMFDGAKEAGKMIC